MFYFDYGLITCANTNPKLIFLYIVSRWFDENWREWVKPEITMPLSELREFLNGEGTLLLQVKFEVISQII